YGLSAHLPEAADLFEIQGAQAHPVDPVVAAGLRQAASSSGRGVGTGGQVRHAASDATGEAVSQGARPVDEGQETDSNRDINHTTYSFCGQVNSHILRLLRGDLRLEA